MSRLDPVKLTPFRFVYRSEEVRQFRNITLQKAERTVDETLSLLLEDTYLTFRQIKNNILIVRKTDSGSANVSPDEVAFADQDRTITGTVSALDDGSALPGVSVILKGTQAGTVTDAEGSYRISVSSESAVLVFSFIGYKTMEVTVDGRSSINVQLESDVTQLTEDTQADIRNKEIGFVFQSFNLLRRATVLENVALPAIYAGMKKSEREKKAIDLLTQVGLADQIYKRPNQLSGGQQQRVAIARALMNDPTIILADEPTGNLDTKSGNDVMGIVKDLNKQGRTIIMITHERDIAKQAQKIVFIRDGLVQKGSYI